MVSVGPRAIQVQQQLVRKESLGSEKQRDVGKEKRGRERGNGEGKRGGGYELKPPHALT